MQTKSSLLLRVWGLILAGVLAGTTLRADNAIAPVAWDGAKLSVHFENSSISQILSSVASVTGMQVSVDPSVSGYQESVSFKNLSLHDAVLKILDGSEIDYIVVGDPKSPQRVSKVFLLGFSPKGSLNQPPGNNPVSQGAQYQQPNPYVVDSQSGMFSGRTMTEQPVPGRVTDSGRFLPFPEAADAPKTQNQDVTDQSKPRAVPPNPFNPQSNATPNTPNPERPQRRRSLRGSGDWPHDER